VKRLSPDLTLRDLSEWAGKEAARLRGRLICTAILASSHGVDLGAAVAAKIETIEERHS
jgi:hypothetical protein